MFSQKQKLVSVLLMVTGAGLIGIAFAADYISASGVNEGFGPKQIILALSGLLILLSGIGLATPIGRRYAARMAELSFATQSALRIRPGDMFMLAIWFGLVTGLAEVVLWVAKTAFQKQLDPTQIMSLHIIWMAPLANLFVFTAAGILLFAAARFWPELLSLRIVVFFFAFLGFLSVLLAVPGLHLIAVMVLTLGLAIQTARWVSAHPGHFFTLIRYSAGWPGFFTYRRGKSEDQPSPDNAAHQDALPDRRQFLVGTGAILAGLAVGVHGWEGLVERQALARIPTLSTDKPNVLLIVMDTVRARNLGLYGYQRRNSPNLERLAQTGVSFERAISTAPWTLPSHATMFTGRWHHELSADWYSALDNTYPTLAETLRDNGYLTAGFVANLAFCSVDHGLSRGFVHYEDFPTSMGQIILSSALGREITNESKLRRLIGYEDILNRKNAAKITNDFLRWHSKQDQRPFFAFLNYYDAHWPYLPPAPFDTKFGPEKPPAEMLYWTNDAKRVDWYRLSQEDTRLEIESYDEAIAYIDHSLGQLFDELARRGVLDNTLVIVTSDHGEQFGEHGLFGHTNSLYLPTLHVPLLLSLPSRLPQGLSLTQAASLRDLPATITDLIGLGDTAPFPGISLAQHWNKTNHPDSPENSPVLSEVSGDGFSKLDWEPAVKGDMKSLVTGRYHFIRNGDGQEELYDWKNDPAEETDLANSAADQGAMEELRTSLDKILATQSVANQP